MSIGATATPATGSELLEAAIRIELLMNKKDERYPRLSERLDEFMDAMILQKSGFNPKGLVDVCQEILKNEWEVLKKELRQINPTP